MVLRAFILIEVTGDHTRSAYKTIQRMSGVQATYLITGSFDLLVKIESESMETLNALLQKVRAVEGVTKTNTCFDLDSHLS